MNKWMNKWKPKRLFFTVVTHLNIVYRLFCQVWGIERVSSVKLLGVHLTDSLSMDEHVRQTISVCNQSLYILCQLKRQGLPLNCLNLVFDSLIMSRLMYACFSFLVWLPKCWVRQHYNTIQKLKLEKVIKLPIYLMFMKNCFLLCVIGLLASSVAEWTWTGHDLRRRGHC